MIRFASKCRQLRQNVANCVKMSLKLRKKYPMFPFWARAGPGKSRQRQRHTKRHKTSWNRLKKINKHQNKTT